MQKRCFSFSPAVKNTKGTDISFFCKTPIFSFSASIDHWVVEKKCPYSAESNVLNLLISDNPKLSVLLLLLQLRFWQKLVCIGGHVCGSLLWESITFQRWTVPRLHCCQSDWFYFSLRATDTNTLLLHKQRLDIRGYKKKSPTYREMVNLVCSKLRGDCPNALTTQWRLSSFISTSSATLIC